MDVTKTHVAKDYKLDRPLISCRFSPDGKHVFTGSEDYKVWRVQVSDGAKVPLDTDAWVRAIDFANVGQTVITGGYEGKIHFWDAHAETPALEKTIEAHDGWIRALAVSPDQQLLASAGNDLIVKLWSLSTGELVNELTSHESHIYNAVFHPSGETLVTGDLYGNIFDWDVATGEKIREWKSESLSKYDKGFRAQIGGFRGMVFSADGSQLACSGITNVSNAFAGVGNPSVVIFDYAKGEQTIEHLTKGPLQGVAWNVKLHSDGTIISGTGGRGGNLLFWKPGEKETFHQLKMKSDIRDLDLSPDGRHLVAAHGNSHLSICLMDAKQG